MTKGIFGRPGLSSVNEGMAEAEEGLGGRDGLGYRADMARDEALELVDGGAQLLGESLS